MIITKDRTSPYLPLIDSGNKCTHNQAVLEISCMAAYIIMKRHSHNAGKSRPHQHDPAFHSMLEYKSSKNKKNRSPADLGTAANCATGWKTKQNKAVWNTVLNYSSTTMPFFQHRKSA